MRGVNYRRTRSESKQGNQYAPTEASPYEKVLSRGIRGVGSVVVEIFTTVEFRIVSRRILMVHAYGHYGFLKGLLA